MIQPKYSPQEALQRIKLMMGYDSKKSLRENVKETEVVLNEQSTDQLSYGQIGKYAKDLNYYLTGDVQTADLEKIQELLNNNVYGKTSEDGSCVLTKLIAYYSKIAGTVGWREFFTTTAALTLGFSEWGRIGLIPDIDKSQERSEGEFEDVKKPLLASIKKELNGFCKAVVKGEKKDETPSDTARQKSINDTYCNNVKDGVIQFGFMKGKTWDFWVNKYKV